MGQNVAGGADGSCVCLFLNPLVSPSATGETQIHKHANSCALAFGGGGVCWSFLCLLYIFQVSVFLSISFAYIIIFTSSNGECEYKAAAFISLSMISIAQLQFKNLWNHQDLDLWFLFSRWLAWSLRHLVRLRASWQGSWVVRLLLWWWHCNEGDGYRVHSPLLVIPLKMINTAMKSFYQTVNNTQYLLFSLLLLLFTRFLAYFFICFCALSLCPKKHFVKFNCETDMGCRCKTIFLKKHA